MIVKDHAAADAELKALAASAGVKLPQDLGAKHKATLEQAAQGERRRLRRT